MRVLIVSRMVRKVMIHESVDYVESGGKGNGP